ncbi:MAG: hypothetical protein NC131_06380 [Roseburia sp.]|nr:hypothetical protein [Roseburia sp.]
MKVTIEKLTDWNLVKRAALQTRNLKMVNPPTRDWKLKMLMAEHSPIRCLQFYITFEDVPYFVHVHLVRHFMGLTPFVSTSRSDLTDVHDRSQRKQTDLVNFSLYINAQALLNISYKRLCNKASKETRELWEMVKEAMKDVDFELYQMMVPACIHQGHCPEMETCGFCKSKMYNQWLSKYQTRYHEF